MCGWLYRKDDRHYPGEEGDAFIKVWCVLDYYHLNYYIDNPGHSGIFGDPFSAGYIKVDKDTAVVIVDDDPEVDKYTGAGLSCFTIKEPNNGVVATFSATNDDDRSAWLTVLYKASSGYKHRSSKRLSLNDMKRDSQDTRESDLMSELESVATDFSNDNGDDDDDDDVNLNAMKDTIPGIDPSQNSETEAESHKPRKRESLQITTADLAQIQSSGRLSRTRLEDTGDSTGEVNQRINYGFVEPPKMIGSLRKKAIGGFFGYRNLKKRWFRLQAGELRYYDKASMTPGRLKNVVSLRDGAYVEPIDDERPDQIVIQFPRDGEKDSSVMNTRGSKGPNLKLYADTPDEAKEWQRALNETVRIYTAAKASNDKHRRKVNIRMYKVNENAKEDKIRAEATSVEGLRINSISSSGGGGSMSVRRMSSIIRSDEATQLLLGALKSHFLLGNMEDEGHRAILENMTCLKLQSGDIATWENTWGTNFYIIEWGEMQVLVKNSIVSILKGGTAFGELALVNEVLRTATIRARLPCRVWSIDRPNFRRILALEEERSKERRIEVLGITYSSLIQ